MVVAEKQRAVKGKYLEWVGSYNPSEGKKLTFKKDRVLHWISMGARPSNSAAALLKTGGMSGMEEFLPLTNKKRAKKNPDAEPAAPAPVAAAVEAPVVEETPVAEEAPTETAEAVVEETPVESAPEVAEEAPAVEEEAPAAEDAAPSEEPSEEPAKEE